MSTDRREMRCPECGDIQEWDEDDSATCCATVYLRKEDAHPAKVHHDTFMWITTLRLELPGREEIDIANSYKWLLPNSQDVILVDGDKVDDKNVEIVGNDDGA